MKNIQIVDGAINEVFEIYQVSDELFKLMFPRGSDIAFLDDIEKILERKRGKRIWEVVYKRMVNKKNVAGIHGTLHLTGSHCSKKYFPTRKEKDVFPYR